MPENKIEWKWLTVESLKQSSDRYGNCEVCNQYVSEVYLLRGKHLKSPFQITHTFGHKVCLELRISESINNL